MDPLTRSSELLDDATPTLRWSGDAFAGRLGLLDQTLLPLECRMIECATHEAVFEAIRSLRVRGAPAIGVAAGFGLYLDRK